MVQGIGFKVYRKSLTDQMRVLPYTLYLTPYTLYIIVKGHH